MTKLSTAILGLTGLAMVAGACTSDTSVATPDDLEQARVRTYRIAHVELPANTTAARELGFDLNGDAAIDNHLGLGYASMLAVSPAYRVVPHAEEALGANLFWTLSVYDDVETGQILAARLSVMDDDMPPALAMLDGSSTILEGDVGRIPLGTLSDALGTSGPGWIDARRLRVELEQIDGQRVQARIGVAVAERDVASALVPNLAAYFTTRLAADDSQFALEADTNSDGVVTAEELSAHEFTRVLLAPDLRDLDELDGGEALSLGFRVIATAQ